MEGESGASAVATWSRCRRSTRSPSRTDGRRPPAGRTSTARSSAAPSRSGRCWSASAGCWPTSPPSRIRPPRPACAARRLQGAGDGAPRPLLGPRPAGRDAGPRQDRRAGCRDLARRRRPRAARRAPSGLRPPRSLPRPAGPQARCPGAAPGARPWRLAALPRRALGRDRGQGGPPGSGPPDGRRAAALPRGRAPAGRARGPRRLAAGACDGRAVALLARRAERPAAPVLQLEERLADVGSPPPTDLSGYDALREVAA